MGSNSFSLWCEVEARASAGAGKNPIQEALGGEI